MGGCGSGNRWSNTTKLEETRQLDIRWMKKQEMLEPCSQGSMKWSRADEPAGEIGFSVHADSMTLSYRYKGHDSDEWAPREETIQFLETHCNYGGVRKWFACPRCDARVAVLYSQSVDFMCRQCSGLKYRSQSDQYYERLNRKRNKLASRIFEDANFCFKKKGMHYRTFEPLYQKWSQLGKQADEVFLQTLVPLLSKTH